MHSNFKVAFLLIIQACLFLPSETVAQQRQTPPSRQLVVTEVEQLPSKEKRWALIIGVDKYEDSGISPLRGAANDARAMAKALATYAGFLPEQIILLTTDEPKERQPSRLNILRRLSNLKGLVPPDGLLFVSFSGHGIDRDNQAFLIPSDAAFTEDISLLEDTAVSVERVKNLIRAMKVSQVLVLLDACRNDPQGGRADSANPLTEAYKRGFSFDVRNKEVSAFATLYATSIGDRAYEYAEKKQGYFSWAITEGLSGKAVNPETGEVTLGSLVKYIEDVVPRQVAIDLGKSKKQNPFAVIEGYRAESLVLAIGNKNASVAMAEATIAESAHWKGIALSGEPRDFEVFLALYPNGIYANDARKAITEITSDRIVTPTKGTFDGAVADGTGLEPIRGVVITFIYELTGFPSKVVRSDSNGRFFSGQLPEGLYEIKFQAKGYKERSVTLHLISTRSNSVIPIPVILERLP